LIINKFAPYLLLFIAPFFLACGNEVEENVLPARKGDLRVISTSPSITEIIYFLGGMESLVGVTDYCHFPEEVESLPKIGALYNPNYEQIIALQPDLVIIIPASEVSLGALRRVGIRLLVVRNETIEDILDSITKIGLAIDRRDAADSLISVLAMDTAADTSQKLIPASLVISRQVGALKDIYVAGKETYLSQMMESAGFINVYADLNNHYSPVSVESFLSKKPLIIIETTMDDEGEAAVTKNIGDWQQLGNVPAVKNGHVYEISSSYIHIPAIRVLGLEKQFREIREQIEDRFRVSKLSKHKDG